ncbi:extracellular solute-binding protein [Paenibacillus sp. GCM10027626]|uniref:extracellular solute-binding protein n=1 Tax=Paenibacillus sp. GCM10027626 TaxID=3273411 RepID=UPI00363A62B8
MYPPKPVSRKTFRERLDHMVATLREEIRGGNYKAGEYLPAEAELVKQFQLSNKSVRKGLEQLVAEGLIVKENRIGSRVAEGAGAEVLVSLGYHPSVERDFILSALIDDFHSLNPKIRIKTSMLRSSEHDTVRDYLENGLVDIFTINNKHFTDSIDMNTTHLLEPLAPDPGAYSFTNEAFMYEGVQFAKPLIYSPILLAYNRDHFAEAGVPEPDGSWTWREAIQHAAALTVPGKRYGLYFHLLSDNRWPAFLLQSGMRFEPDVGGEFQLAGTRLLDCIRLCKEIITTTDVFPNYMSENNKDVNELFLQGKVSMIISNYMMLNELKHSDIRYDISPLPYLFEPRSLINVIGVAVNRSGKEKEGALRVAEYFGSLRAQQLIRRHSLSLPAVKEAAEAPLSSNESLNRPSRFFLFRETMFSYRLHKELNLSRHAFATFRQLLKKYWSGLIGETELCELSRSLFKE